MKLRLIALGFALGAASALLGSTVLSQEQPGGDRAASHGPEEMARMMQLWEEIATPGEKHRALHRLVGEWEYTSRIWTAGPEDEPMETHGTAETRLIYDGRFIESTYSGEMMGRTFEGRTLMGFDNYRKKYVSVWMDNMNTAVHISEGLLDQTGDVITSYGTLDDWMSGERDKPVKYVHRIIDEDTVVFEMHDLSIVPGETRVLEITSRRRE